jgi:hypothetical protein
VTRARDVLEGLGGAGVIAGALATPGRRARRARWGVGATVAARGFPGDDLVPAPRSRWTHGVEIDAPAEEVWPWVAQVGAGRGGFYSYEWLENLVGCRLRNADAVHPEWEVRQGDDLFLHPKQPPPLSVVEVARGRHFVAYAQADRDARAAGKPWMEASWLFLVEPLGPSRSRVISRYRCTFPDRLVTRLAFGAVLEAIGYAMDRRMLLGIRERAEGTPLRRNGVRSGP